MKFVYMFAQLACMPNSHSHATYLMTWVHQLYFVPFSCRETVRLLLIAHV
jgi:hypothetical protein